MRFIAAILWLTMVVHGAVGYSQATHSYDRGPSLRMACYSQTDKVSAYLQKGANLCRAVADIPEDPDLEEVHYLVQLQYIDSAGKYQTDESVVRQRMYRDPIAPIDIPLYVPEDSLLNAVTRIFEGALNAMVNDYKAHQALATAISIPDLTIVTVVAGIQGLSILLDPNSSTNRFLAETSSIVGDLLFQKKRVLRLTVLARYCSEHQCSPWSMAEVSR